MSCAVGERSLVSEQTDDCRSMALVKSAAVADAYVDGAYLD